MPLPTPRKGQTQKEWVSACMANETLLKDYPDTKQRLAVCYSIWARRDMSEADGYEQRSVSDAFRAEQSVTDFSPIVRGYPIVFNSLSEDLGGFKERIMPGAFDRTLAEKVDVRALINHDESRPVGRLSAGTLRLTVKSHGVFSEVDLPNTTAARDLTESMRRGDVTGGSFRFRVVSDDFRMEDGMPVRLISDMLVREISIGVVLPAYEETDLSVAKRSLDAFLERQPKGPTVVQLRAQMHNKLAAWK